MKLIQLYVNHNTGECKAVFGEAFDLKPYGCLRDLPKTKDGKEVYVLGLTPYTAELTIPFSYDQRMKADSICSYSSVESMISELKSLSDRDIVEHTDNFPANWANDPWNN